MEKNPKPPKNGISIWKCVDFVLKKNHAWLFSGIVWPLRWTWHPGYNSIRCLLFELCSGPFPHTWLCLAAIMAVSQQDWCANSLERGGCCGECTTMKIYRYQHKPCQLPEWILQAIKIIHVDFNFIVNSA